MSADKMQRDEYGARLALAAEYARAGNYDGAISACKAAIKIDPSRSQAYIDASEILIGLGYPESGRDALLDASRRAPSPEVSRRLGEVFLRCGQPLEAIPWATAAAEHRSEEVRALTTLALAFRDTLQPQEEERALSRLMTVSPNDPSVYALQGQRLQILGQFDEAEAHLRKSIELRPRQGKAYQRLTAGRRVTESDAPLVAQMERVLAQGGLDLYEEGHLRYALGKSYDNLGRYGPAMEQFVAANRLLRQVAIGLRRFDRAAFTAKIDRTIAFFNRETVNRPVETPAYDLTPIVIGGMMRSGTTLTEQIVSRHPEVGSSGELAFWREVAKQFVSNEDPATSSESVLREVLPSRGQIYIDLLRKFSPGFSFVAEKDPGNQQVYGLIHMAMPKAPIIHLRRNLADVAISIFTTLTSTGEEYVWDRADIVFALKEYRRLEEHWHSVLPEGRVFEVGYAELVGDQEATTRRLIAYCGLEWDDACLTPETNDRRVLTPSLWQVRQPVNRGSVDRWRKYEPWLGPFAELVDL